MHALFLIDYILHAALNNHFKVSLLTSEVLILGPADEGVKALHV